ncbi:MAG: glycerophosphodiester phosphodiesterase [Ahniella sp.]|nr:glycerophosphodiester phosphodiesterase [Ahniella sp.]
MAAYDLGVAQGADVIEPDLVSTADHQLIARHDAWLSRSTDVAERPEFAERRRRGWGDLEDWWAADFTIAELGRLRARQPWPERDQSFMDATLPDFKSLLTWLIAQRPHTPIRLYPELKHPEEHEADGFDPTARLISDLEGSRMTGRESPVWVQCFRIEPLRRVRERIDNPVFALFESRHIDGAEWLRAQIHRHPWLDGFALPKSSLYGEHGYRLVQTAHELGKSVHTWTIRDDQVAEGFVSAAAELTRVFELGVDAVFCDFPGTAVRARSDWIMGHKIIPRDSAAEAGTVC